MNLQTGIDIIEIERIQSALNRHGKRFLRRIFTPGEIEDCAGKVESLAARFAAKEAAVKALDCGIGVVTWLEVEIRRGDNGEPVLVLHEAAERLAKELRLTVWSVSLSHSGGHAIAMVVAMGE